MKTNIETIVGYIDMMRYFGAADVVLDGEEGVFIPYSPNRSIVKKGRAVYANVRIVPSQMDMSHSHIATAQLPWSYAQTISLHDRQAQAPVLGSFGPLGSRPESGEVKPVGEYRKPADSDMVYDAEIMEIPL